MEIVFFRRTFVLTLSLFWTSNSLLSSLCFKGHKWKSIRPGLNVFNLTKHVASYRKYKKEPKVPKLYNLCFQTLIDLCVSFFLGHLLSLCLCCLSQSLYHPCLSPVYLLCFSHPSSLSQVAVSLSTSAYGPVCLSHLFVSVSFHNIAEELKSTQTVICLLLQHSLCFQ